MVFAALLEYATGGYMGKRIAMRKSRTQQIVRLLNEHREKCIAAAAAAAVSTCDDKDGDDDGEPCGRNSLLRTASLYPSLERIDLENSSQKRVCQSICLLGQTSKCHFCYVEFQVQFNSWTLLLQSITQPSQRPSTTAGFGTFSIVEKSSV